MNVLYVVIGAGIFLAVAYSTYGKFLSKKVFQLDDTRETPAVSINDGLDYVPAKKSMLSGQHFSAIAAAGPINGPILAGVMFGWVPALIWVLIGSVFIGGVHDMGSLVASIRHKAKSITEVIRVNVIPVNLPIADLATAQKVWGLLILGYCLIASVMPMWLILQPRGALGGYFLYASLIFSAIGLVFGGFTVQYPAFTNMAADSAMDTGFWFPMFPVLFITIACGACSGFHALVSSGTTSKQLARESDAKPVGYGVMLLEGMVAVVSIACVMILTKDSQMITKAPNFIYASAMGSFMELIGVSAALGISFGLMAFTTFVYDTLDVCTRLGRYIVEELTGLKNWTGKLLGTLLTAGVPVFFLFQTMADEKGNPVPAWKIFWNTFGASNQLLAALALLGIGVWLSNTRKNSKVWLVAFIPAVLMFIMSNWALVMAVYSGWFSGNGHPAIPVISMILIILSVLVAAETSVSYFKKRMPL